MSFCAKKPGKPTDKAIKERKRRKIRRVLKLLHQINKVEDEKVDFLLIIQERNSNTYKKVKYTGTGDMRDKFEHCLPIFDAETKTYQLGFKEQGRNKSTNNPLGMKLISECTTIGKKKDKGKESTEDTKGQSRSAKDKSKATTTKSKSTPESKSASTSESQSTSRSTETATKAVKAVKGSTKKSPKKQGSAWNWRKSQCSDGEEDEDSDYTLNSEDYDDDDDDDDFDLDDGGGDMFSDDDTKGDSDRELVDKVIGDLGNTTEKLNENTEEEGNTTEKLNGNTEEDKTTLQENLTANKSGRQDVTDSSSKTAAASADKTKNLWIVPNNDSGQVIGELGDATDQLSETPETDNRTKQEPLTPTQDALEHIVTNSSIPNPAVYAYEKGTWWVVQNTSSGKFVLESSEFEESSGKTAAPKSSDSSQKKATVIGKTDEPTHGTEMESEQVTCKEDNLAEIAPEIATRKTKGSNSSGLPYVLRKSTRKRASRDLIEYTPAKKKHNGEDTTTPNSCAQNSVDAKSSSSNLFSLLSTTEGGSTTTPQSDKTLPSSNTEHGLNPATSGPVSVQSRPQLDSSTPSGSSPQSTVEQVKDVMFMMNQFMCIQQQQFQEEIDRRERMHSDRMSVFKGLVDTLKLSMDKGGT